MINNTETTIKDGGGGGTTTTPTGNNGNGGTSNTVTESYGDGGVCDCNNSDGYNKDDTGNSYGDGGVSDCENCNNSGTTGKESYGDGGVSDCNDCNNSGTTGNESYGDGGVSDCDDCNNSGTTGNESYGDGGVSDCNDCNNSGTTGNESYGDGGVSDCNDCNNSGTTGNESYGDGGVSDCENCDGCNTGGGNTTGGSTPGESGDPSTVLPGPENTQPESITVDVGEKLFVGSFFSPEFGCGYDIIEIEGDSIERFGSGNNLLMPVKPGVSVATIEAMTENNVVARKKLTVTVRGIALSLYSNSISGGEIFELTADLVGVNEDSEINWDWGDDFFAAVEDGGKVIRLKAKTIFSQESEKICNVKANCTIDDMKFESSCTVAVKSNAKKRKCNCCVNGIISTNKDCYIFGFGGTGTALGYEVENGTEIAKKVFMVDKNKMLWKFVNVHGGYRIVKSGDETKCLALADEGNAWAIKNVIENDVNQIFTLTCTNLDMGIFTLKCNGKYVSFETPRSQSGRVYASSVAGDNALCRVCVVDGVGTCDAILGYDSDALLNSNVATNASKCGYSFAGIYLRDSLMEDPVFDYKKVYCYLGKMKIISLLQITYDEANKVNYANTGAEYIKFLGRSGTDHATKACQRALRINQPENSAIYFCVDSDYERDLLVRVIQYFNDINQYFVDNNYRFEIGVYGSEYTCEELMKVGLVKYTFVSGSSGWSKSSSGWDKMNFDLFQCFEYGNTWEEMVQNQYNAYLGIGVDTDIGVGNDIGAWEYNDDN